MPPSKKHQTSDEYYNSLSGNRKEMLLNLRTIILSKYPDVEETLFYNVPAFKLIKGGKRDALILIAAFKNHVGFYPHEDIIHLFESDLKQYSTSKGTIQFPLDKALPENLILKMIESQIRMLSAQ